MNKLGFSVIYAAKRSPKFYAELFEDMLSSGCQAVELHMPEHDKLDDPQLLRLIGEFSYRAIHTSDLHAPERDKEALSYYRSIAERIGAAAITIHPHTMEGWGWTKSYFGNIASFENMDRFKPFGNTVHDMQRVMADHPGARWTFDLNHVYTNDPSLASVPQFYEQLGDPGHYHISGFRDEQLPHTTLHSTRQDSIIEAVSTDAPIIIESLGLDDIHLFHDELRYVAARLSV